MSSAGDLVVTGLTKSFGDVAVLDGLSLSVASGTFLALLGPSGSGKTTLLRTLAGFERPEAGTVAIGDRVVEGEGKRVPPERRRVGYVSQDGSLFPHLTVAANVAFGLKRSERRGTRVAGLLAMVDLAAFGARYPHELSGGQQQRVAIARALAVDPVLVLLDEPFAALDDNLRQAVRADVARILRDHGATVVLVTHDQDEALSTADLVAVLAHGAVAQVAAPDALYQRPATLELATLVGSANLLDGEGRGAVVLTALGALVVAEPTTPGAAVTVVVRPEQLMIEPIATGAGANGTVSSIRFHGHDAVVVVALEDAAHDALAVRILGATDLTVGARVRVGVRGTVTAFADPPPSATISPPGGPPTSD